jgi:hypothetical protein
VGIILSVRPEVLCGLLAEEERLRVYAAVLLGAGTPSEVAERSGVPPRDVVVALRRLETGGLLNIVDGRYVAETGEFKDAVREYGPENAPEEPLEPDRQRAAVLRTFVRDGRLLRVPAARAKRRIVLEHIAACFEPGVRYPERAVDAILRAWYDDYAALRRYLIDEDLMAREAGLYWRTGGYVDVS